MRHGITELLAVGLALLIVESAVAGAQASDASARLRQVLPADVATRVLAVIATARSHDLPAAALENRALKFAAKGVDAASIERSVTEQAERMERVRDVMLRARSRAPSGDEIEAGAEAMRKGVDGSKVSALAKSAPADRSLAVALYVVGSLVDRGLRSDSALTRVEERLKAHASDHDLEKLSGSDGAPDDARRGNKPAETGRDLAATKRPGSAAGNGQSGSAGGPPAGVPPNGGKPATPPGLGKKPTTPPGKKP